MQATDSKQAVTKGIVRSLTVQSSFMPIVPRAPSMRAWFEARWYQNEDGGSGSAADFEARRRKLACQVRLLRFDAVSYLVEHSCRGSSRWDDGVGIVRVISVAMFYAQRAEKDDGARMVF